METFRCIDCKVEKDRSEYKASDKYSKGYVSRCKPCETIKNREARKRKTDRINGSTDQYLNVKLKNMRKYDRRMGIEVFGELTLEDVKKLIDRQNNICCYTGVKLEWRLDADIYHKGSFDRIDTKFGHEVDNLMVSSVHANLLRGSLPRDEFLRKLENSSLDHVDIDDIIC